MYRLCPFVCSLLLAAPVIAQKTPQEFVDFAAQTDMIEAHIGQMAQQKADSQAVKNYGKTLDSSHTTDYDRLTAAATKLGLPVPKSIDEKHWDVIAPLEKLQGPAFDHRFLQKMVAGHESAISRYEQERSRGQSAALRHYAATALPVLQKHLDDAKALLRKGAK